MPFTKTTFPGLLVFEPTVFEDSRGYFFESYNYQTLNEALGVDFNFIQDNQAKSHFGVIRGLHLQREGKMQTKLIRVLQGNILDVVVDVRKDSPTYGKWISVELSDENQKQLLVPKGFAHGYAVLSETAVVFYKCDEFYDKDSEDGIYVFDEELNIDWQIDRSEAQLSERDKHQPHFKDFKPLNV